MLYSMSFVAGILIWPVSDISFLFIESYVFPCWHWKPNTSRRSKTQQHLELEICTERMLRYYYIYICVFGRCFYAKQITLHSCWTFDQFMHSLGIQPMTLLSLAPCLAVWATGMINHDALPWKTASENPSISQATDDWSVSHWWWCALVFISLLVR